MFRRNKSRPNAQDSVRKLQRALRLSEASRKAWLESSLDSVVCTDRQGKIIEFSPAAERTFRISRIAALGKNFVDLVLPLSLPQVERDAILYGLSSAGAQVLGSRLESVALRSDGTEFPAEFTISKNISQTATILVITIRDIAARVRAEEEIIRLASIVESSQDAIYGTDLDGKIRTWNKGAERMYGYKIGEVLEKSVTMLIPPGAQDEFAEIMANLREGLQMRDLETVRMAKDGTLIDVSLSVSPILDSRGQVSGTSAIARDITSRKVAEEALRRANETSVYASPIPIIGLDRDGKINMWNPAAQSVFGWSEQEILGKVNPTIPEGEEYATGLLYEKVLGGKTIHGVECNRRNRDGFQIAISLSAAPVRDVQGRVKGFIKFLTDISEQKRIEGALRTAEEKYRSIFEHSFEGIYQITPQGKYLVANPPLAKMFGFASPQELLELDAVLANKKYVNPDTRSEFLKRMEQEGMVQNFQYQAYRNDLKIIWVSENARVIRDAEGSISHFEGSVEDITELRELEEQFRQMQKIEAVGRLAGGVAHDFNNILMAVSSFAELVAKKLPDDSPVRNYIDEILKATDRGSALTQSLLAFSRKQVFLPKVVDLNSVIHGQIGMLKRLIGENIELKFLPEERLGAVKVDPGQIEQVVMNLVINARDAMPDGGELILATKNAGPPPCADSQGWGTGQCVTLCVQDTGSGIDADTRSHLFEPFFTTKPQGKGTGLGLATVFGIVKQNGGYIEVESEPGNGTAFTIYLPQVNEALHPAGPDPVQPALVGTETILLVEDEDSVRESTAKYLRENGYTVLMAKQGMEAIEVARHHLHDIHLLLSDLVMPKMSGIELADRIALTRPTTKVIFMSGYSKDLFAGRPDTEPRHLLLHKPFRLLTLGRRIREVLDRSQA